LSESVGASVTFWGARLARANALSGGGASLLFKGYANMEPEITLPESVCNRAEAPILRMLELSN